MTASRSDRGLRTSAFPPIAEYAFLSDCETTALVAPNGNVEWADEQRELGGHGVHATHESTRAGP